ncbi:hypothetical protein BB561_002739 [Smittium simulii]|uniref:DNA topoisomerase 2 n=1 Tax=Smittium simulii TaxID=133385 RepID=A0A2T9YPK8_9FUNG|nr:hypothetical protein BB561_002739 [Smittium simulii]
MVQSTLNSFVNSISSDNSSDDDYAPKTKKAISSDSEFEDDDSAPSTKKLNKKNNPTSSTKPQAEKKQVGKSKRAVEDIYQKKSQLEHILLRPDTYIGSVEPIEENMWVYNKQTERMERDVIKYTPGLYKIVDEILVNAADNKIRDNNMEVIKVTIDQEKGEISVYNDGKGIPIEIHKTEKVYVPELIFGHLLTSSNYDDDEKKVTGGRNGYGAKLCNIFSTVFEIETTDISAGKKYKQTFKNSMSEKGKPSITKYSNKSEYTKVSFIPDFEKFKMTHLDDGITRLITRRVYDLAGCVAGVKVYLNGERIKIKNFKDYVDLYVQPPKPDLSNPDDIKPIPQKVNVVYQRISDRWEVGMAVTDGQFQQVSFANSVNTVKGGTHVNYVADQIINKVILNLKKKNKNSNVRPYQVKNHMWVFVNALIENPAFDSQTKETLTLRFSSFGSKCEIDDDFIKKVMKTDLSSFVMNFVKFKEHQSLKKTDGAKSGRISGIIKLEDANQAGTRNSKNCTLILTEGDSAKTLAISGLSVIGRDNYGVFPLKGKMLNVRDATSKQVSDNAEINNIKQILGLKHGQEYSSIDSLRYGHLMIMADQDVDGSHIKGLLINFFDTYFPSLIKLPGFLLDFITPVVKATKRNKTISFYSEPEFAEWRNSVPNGGKDWSIKYYKGLGTSSSQEAKEYFGNLIHHRKNFLPATDTDRKMIDLAFNKARADDRKEWLGGYVPGTYLDSNIKEVPVSEFINKELVLYSIADTARSIPSVVDGFKPTQRKIIYGCFKRNLKNEIKVAALAGYISEQTAYHHGEQSLTQAITAMAQDFVGSNNINLLDPRGQFGSRLQGGKDAASSRYIFTALSAITRNVFNSSDSVLLNYVEDDGKLVEPQWYIPVVPMVLVNGAEGIGTGWSTSIPNYNPEQIVDNLRKLMNGEEPVPMLPWYRGFNGEIELVSPNRYRVTGLVEQIDETTIRITELPVKVWTQNYKEQLEVWRIGNEKIQPIIKDYKEYHTDTKVDFYLTLTETQMSAALKEGLEIRFKLSSSISTSNMVCFDREGRIKKYESPEAILMEYYPLRLRYYQLRKESLTAQLTEEWEKLSNKARFVLEIIQKKLIVQNRKKKDIVLDLVQRGYKKIAKNKAGNKKKKGVGNMEGYSEDENSSSAEQSEDEQDTSDGVNASDFDYLLSMPIWNLTYEKFEKLNKERDECQAQLDALLKKSPKDLWNTDLNEFLDLWEKKIEHHANLEVEEASARNKHDRQTGAGRGRGRGKRATVTSRTPKTTKTIKKNTIEDDLSDAAINYDSDDSFKAAPKAKPKPSRTTAKTKDGTTNTTKKSIKLEDSDFNSDDDKPLVPKAISKETKNGIKKETIISDDESYSKPLTLTERLNMIRKKQPLGENLTQTKSISELSEPVPSSSILVKRPNSFTIDLQQPKALKQTKQNTIKESFGNAVKKTKISLKREISDSDSDSDSKEIVKKRVNKTAPSKSNENSPNSITVGRARRAASTKAKKYKIESDEDSAGDSESDLEINSGEESDSDS